MAAAAYGTSEPDGEAAAVRMLPTAADASTLPYVAAMRPPVDAPNRDPETKFCAWLV